MWHKESKIIECTTEEHKKPKKRPDFKGSAWLEHPHKYHHGEMACHSRQPWNLDGTSSGCDWKLNFHFYHLASFSRNYIEFCQTEFLN
jgi:hypothetical protein